MHWGAGYASAYPQLPIEWRIFFREKLMEDMDVTLPVRQ